MKIEISCPGKIILMGEHAVVYNRPAIVAAINRRMTANFVSKDGISEIKIKSKIPIGIGMGSSAALSVILAASRVLLSKGIVRLSPRNLAVINKTAYEFEKTYHGQASGVDTTVITHGGILWFRKIKEGKFTFKKLARGTLRKFVLVNTGKPKETTKEMVEKIKNRVKSRKYKAETWRLFDEIGKQTKILWHGLETKNYNLIASSIENGEICLEDLGLVGKKAKNIIREIEAIGGAAKVSGGGGLTGGSGMLLCFHQNPEKIIALAKKLNLESFRIKLGEEGVRLE